MKEKIKFYASKDLMDKHLKLVALLEIFWDGVERPDDIASSRTKRHRFNKDFFELTDSLGQCDYIMMPHDYWQLKNSNRRLFDKIIDISSKSKKPLLIDASGDVHGRIFIPNSRVMRVNQYRFSLPSYEITVPLASEDLLESYCDGKIVFRTKRDIPTIGFVGWADVSFRQKLKTLIRQSPKMFLSLFDRKLITHRKGVFWRKEALDILRSSSFVRSNFIVRDAYTGNSTTVRGEYEKNRREFVDNLLNSDYALIVRGDANASARFYEALSLGRIPIFVDTACVLPLEDKIAYEDFCLFIDYADIRNMPHIISDFHKNLSQDNFIAMQAKARYTFENYLRYDAFSRYLAEILGK